MSYIPGFFYRFLPTFSYDPTKESCDNPIIVEHMDMQPFGNMGQNWAPWNWDGFHATNGQTSKMEECLNETRDFIFLEYLQHIFGLNPYSDVNW